MKKTALVTCYFQHNYGSQLQALATEMICDKLGVDCETIRIDGLKAEINRAKYRYFISKIFDRKTVADKMATVRKFLAKKTNAKYASDLAVRDSIFEKFANEKFHLSPRYNSKEELSEAGYSTFLVGSDQLWLPSNIAADYYTLNFVPEGVNKIAYATSFGVSSLPKAQAELAKKFLPRMNHILVRESSGQRLIKQLTGMDVSQVGDPTMLFDAEQWGELIPQTRRIEHKYVLCYFLGNNPQQREFARKLAESQGCKIVQLPNLDEYIDGDEGFADFPLYDVSPLDFVALVRDAEYVLTDSFHCTVFSCIFSKIFFSFARYADEGGVSTNSRIYSLLESVGASERLFRGGESADDALAVGLDFEKVHGRMAELKKKSVALLSKALNI